MIYNSKTCRNVNLQWLTHIDPVFVKEPDQKSNIWLLFYIEVGRDHNLALATTQAHMFSLYIKFYHKAQQSYALLQYLTNNRRLP